MTMTYIPLSAQQPEQIQVQIIKYQNKSLKVQNKLCQHTAVLLQTSPQ